MFSQFIAASYSNISPAVQETFYRCISLISFLFISVLTIYVAEMDLRMLYVEFGVIIGIILIYWSMISAYRHKYRCSRLDKLEANLKTIRRRRGSIINTKTKEDAEEDYETVENFKQREQLEIEVINEVEIPYVQGTLAAPLPNPLLPNMYDADNHHHNHHNHHVNVDETDNNTIGLTTPANVGRHRKSNIDTYTADNNHEESCDTLTTRMLQQKLDAAHSNMNRLSLRDIERKIKDAQEENDKNASISTILTSHSTGKIKRGTSSSFSSNNVKKNIKHRPTLRQLTPCVGVDTDNFTWQPTTSYKSNNNMKLKKLAPWEGADDALQEATQQKTFATAQKRLRNSQATTNAIQKIMSAISSSNLTSSAQGERQGKGRDMSTTNGKTSSSLSSSVTNTGSLGFSLADRMANASSSSTTTTSAVTSTPAVPHSNINNSNDNIDTSLATRVSTINRTSTTGTGSMKMKLPLRLGNSAPSSPGTSQPSSDDEDESDYYSDGYNSRDSEEEIQIRNVEKI
jgi:hypothetical protein